MLTMLLVEYGRKIDDYAHFAHHPHGAIALVKSSASCTKNTELVFASQNSLGNWISWEIQFNWRRIGATDGHHNSHLASSLAHQRLP